MGTLSFEGEANIMLEFADFGPGQVKVGDHVRLVFRIKDFDDKRDFRRYFWKPAQLSLIQKRNCYGIRNKR